MDIEAQGGQPTQEWQKHTKERNVAQWMLYEHAHEKLPELQFEKWHDQYGARFKAMFEKGKNGWKDLLDLIQQFPEAPFEEIEQRFNNAAH